MADILNASFDYMEDTALDCSFFVPGQGGTELTIGVDGSATVLSGFDVDFLPRTSGPITSEEADQLNTIGASWIGATPTVPSPLTNGTCQERVTFGTMSAIWNGTHTDAPAPALALRDLASQIIARLMPLCVHVRDMDKRVSKWLLARSAEQASPSSTDSASPCVLRERYVNRILSHDGG
jgi:hypothetical protein